MMTLTVFLMTAPPDVTCVPELLTPSIAVFARGLQAEESPTLRLQTIKTATPIVAAAHSLIATPFIHALGPLVIDYLKRMSSSLPESRTEVAIVFEALRFLESLVIRAEENKKVSRG